MHYFALLFPLPKKKERKYHFHEFVSKKKKHGTMLRVNKQNSFASLKEKNPQKDSFLYSIVIITRRTLIP